VPRLRRLCARAGRGAGRSRGGTAGSCSAACVPGRWSLGMEGGGRSALRRRVGVRRGSAWGVRCGHAGAEPGCAPPCVGGVLYLAWPTAAHCSTMKVGRAGRSESESGFGVMRLSAGLGMHVRGRGAQRVGRAGSRLAASSQRAAAGGGLARGRVAAAAVLVPVAWTRWYRVVVLRQPRALADEQLSANVARGSGQPLLPSARTRVQKLIGLASGCGVRVPPWGCTQPTLGALHSWTKKNDQQGDFPGGPPP
jgi:hypothetical protein